MKKTIKTITLVVVVVMLFSAGCNLGGHAPEIEQVGQTTVDVGATVSMFNPVIGAWILAIGGLVVAAGKMLSLIDKKKKE